MSFTSPLFLFGFLPLAALVQARLPAGVRRPWLLACSLAFYGVAAGPWPLSLLVAATGAAFIGGRVLSEARAPGARRRGLFLVLSPLAMLAFFKYGPTPTGFFPLGVSFYTFNLVGYGLDIFWGRGAPARSLVDLLTYVTFFPTVSAGPLLRYGAFENEAASLKSPGADRIAQGVFVLILGLAKKLLIADPLGRLIEPLFADPGRLGVWGAWLAVLGFHFRLYFDFSGYSDMALGMGHLLGVTVPANFDSPYTARSLTEFWQRWHITLSNWFRDYLFYPLAFALRNLHPRRAAGGARSVALIVSMTLIGLWHGAALTFPIWGLAQGIVLALHARAREARRPPWPPWLGRLATSLTLLLGWALFGSSSFGKAGTMLAALVGLRGVEAGPTAVPGVDGSTLGVIALLLVLTNVRRDVPSLSPRPGWAFAFGLAALLTVTLLFMAEPSAFIYFQF